MPDITSTFLSKLFCKFSVLSQERKGYTVTALHLTDFYLVIPVHLFLILDTKKLRMNTAMIPLHDTGDIVNQCDMLVLQSHMGMLLPLHLLILWWVAGMGL